ncbi:glycosyltransferase [Cellulophaga sp. L1A9]|uniref:glycosyltransferase n=1 Tax=Cellulophaga sp. L1A9 TaxID=2686362 RepID=UPI00131B0A36|nr:glycosyltransferase [Cellulophaga sp. L1A9]
MEYNLTISVVLFNTDLEEINNVIRTVLASKLKVKLFFVDNSPNRSLENHIRQNESLEYIYSNQNVGFGAGHNLAISKTKDISEFHLVLNADVTFEASILEECYNYMKVNQNTGLLAPKILNPDGTIQYSVKLLPSPLNLIIRRFIPIKSLKKKMDYNYEFHFFDFNEVIEIPYAMGCFLFINTKIFEMVNGFDERFFMYPEDIDLTRRIAEHSKAIFYPKVTIIHKHGRGSYKNRKLLYYHITSMIKYFNKWGWIFDKGRKAINKKTLSQFDLQFTKNK